MKKLLKTQNEDGTFNFVITKGEEIIWQEHNVADASLITIYIVRHMIID